MGNVISGKYSYRRIAPIGSAKDFGLKILNVMLGMGLGGIEQAFIDYTHALKIAGHDVSMLIRRRARIETDARHTGSPVFDTVIGGVFHIPSYIRTFLCIKKMRPDAIICHGGRACQITRMIAFLLKIPHIAVCHNYSFKHVKKSNFLFVITNDIRRQLITQGFAENRLFVIPNMVATGVDIPIHTKNGDTLTLGAMGRFVPKKGFHVLIDAMEQLKNGPVPIRLKLGGDGPERRALETRAQRQNRGDFIEFLGWTKDKESFFRDIDIFCLPSLHEPFGIVVLEAMRAGKLVIASTTEGPTEIIQDKITGLFFQNGDAASLMDAVNWAISNPHQVLDIERRAQIHVRRHYSIEQGAKNIDSALMTLLTPACH